MFVVWHTKIVSAFDHATLEAFTKTLVVGPMRR
jgi:hypothetical protein